MYATGKGRARGRHVEGLGGVAVRRAGRRRGQPEAAAREGAPHHADVLAAVVDLGQWSRRRFRSRATDCVGESGMERMSGGADERWCG
jgi:hypothetical protein